MFQYRVYDLDSAGCLARPPYELICGEDETAIAEAWQLRSANGAEVWQGSRMVMRLPGSSNPSPKPSTKGRIPSENMCPEELLDLTSHFASKRRWQAPADRRQLFFERDGGI